ncbi:MAG: DUF6051 family protein [Myxococcota bacterium]
MTLHHPNYSKLAQALRRGEGPGVLFEGDGAELVGVPFHSRQARYLLGHDAYACAEHGLHFPGEPASDGAATDCEVQENLHFHYPLLKAHEKGGGQRAKRLVMVLNGLNERSYAKYLPWAWQLWKTTGAAVALFPLSFHVNRVHPSWGRTLESHLERRRAVPNNENTHSYNCILSERLELRPERFFWGGVQSYGDVVDFVRAVREGQHPHVDPHAQIDFLGYSAGGYLALGLLLGDEGGLFEASRAVLFESGAAMRATHLSTRLIMDLACEVALMKLYVRFTPRLANARLAHWLAEHDEGRWFRALFGEEKERPRFEARLQQLAPRLLAIANTNDDVIPSSLVFNTMKGKHRDTGVRVEELDLGVHEAPFVCPDYEQKDRRFVTEVLDEGAWGAGFARFIELSAGLFG